MTNDRTRPPRPPPFPIGTVLRYDGDRRIYRDTEGKEPLLQPGLIVKVTDVRPGRQGTGRLLSRDEYGDEIYDETRDGSSVYQIRGQGRLIYTAEDRGAYHYDRWTVVVPAPNHDKPRVVTRSRTRRRKKT